MVGNPSPLVPALLVFIAVAFGTLALALLIEIVRLARQRRAVLGRLDPDEGTPQRVAARLLHRPNVAPATGLERVVARIPGLRGTRLRIEQAGMRWPLRTYLLLAGGSGVAFGVAWFILTGSQIVAITIGALATLLPELFVYRRKLKRLRTFEEQFPEAIDLLGRAIRAGHPLAAGIRMVADETPEPVAGEFRQVFEEQRFGLPFEEALLGLSDRNTLVDVRIFVTAVLIQREVGGNLTEILDKISQTVRSRFSIMRQLRVYTAQGRTSGFVLAVLPILVAAGLWLVQPDYIRLLWTSEVGQMMVVGAILLEVIGFFWINRVVDIRV